MSNIDRSLIIKKNKNFGRIICRCENISEFEVIEALSNPLDAKVLSSVKYRLFVKLMPAGSASGQFQLTRTG